MRQRHWKSFGARRRLWMPRPQLNREQMWRRPELLLLVCTNSLQLLRLLSTHCIMVFSIRLIRNIVCPKNRVVCALNPSCSLHLSTLCSYLVQNSSVSCFFPLYCILSPFLRGMSATNLFSKLRSLNPY